MVVHRSKAPVEERAKLRVVIELARRADVQLDAMKERERVSQLGLKGSNRLPLLEERLALIVDRERLYRDNQRRTRLLRGARLKVTEASVEDINYKAARGLDKRQIAALAGGEWIRRSQNLLITGATELAT